MYVEHTLYICIPKIVLGDALPEVFFEFISPLPQLLQVCCLCLPVLIALWAHPPGSTHQWVSTLHYLSHGPVPLSPLKAACSDPDSTCLHNGGSHRGSGSREFKAAFSCLRKRTASDCQSVCRRKAREVVDLWASLSRLCFPHSFFFSSFFRIPSPRVPDSYLQEIASTSSHHGPLFAFKAIYHHHQVHMRVLLPDCTIAPDPLYFVVSILRKEDG